MPHSHHCVQAILKEIDEEFTEEELDGIISDVRPRHYYFFSDSSYSLQIDSDKSSTIDFNEFVKIMT